METIKVLICDDHFFYRAGIKNWLCTKKDIDVIGECEDGLVLLKYLKHTQPDVILLDINMPVMDGTVALAEIKKNYPDIKVVMLTMNDSKQMILEMLKLGANGYLTKNEDPEEIYKSIVSCKKTGQYITNRNSEALLYLLKESNLKSEAEVVEEKELALPVKNEIFNIWKVLFFSALLTMLVILTFFAITQLKQNLSPIDNFTN